MKTEDQSIFLTVEDLAARWRGVSDFLCVRRFSPEVSFSEPA